MVVRVVRSPLTWLQYEVPHDDPIVFKELRRSYFAHRSSPLWIVRVLPTTGRIARVSAFRMLQVLTDCLKPSA